MRTNFSDLDIRFTIGDTRFQALNIIYENFYAPFPATATAAEAMKSIMFPMAMAAPASTDVFMISFPARFT